MEKLQQKTLIHSQKGYKEIGLGLWVPSTKVQYNWTIDTWNSDNNPATGFGTQDNVIKLMTLVLTAD
jgi:hypothetical protein